MPDPEALYQVAGHVATITLNRPDKLNAWTGEMEQAVRSAMTAADSDPAVRIILLTGAGRGFCAGADMTLLNSLAASGLAPNHRTRFLENSDNSPAPSTARPDFRKKYSYFPSLSKPVVAAINGPAVGLGFILSLYCDLRIAASSARFGTAFARRGLIAEYGVAWMLPRLIGPANALDLLLSARIVDAPEALHMGLVNRVLPDDGFLPAVQSWAAELAASASPRSMRVIKRQVYDALFQTLGEAFESAENEMILSLQSSDFQEGVAHFLEKRPPRFTGE